MTDQFATEPLSAHSASYNDGVIVGQIQSISSDLSGGFVRQIIGGKSAIELNTPVFSSKNLLYSERLNFISGSTGRGASSVLFSQNISANEKIFDSFVPSPPEISLANGTIFAFTEGSGALPGSALHGIPPTRADSVDLIITDDSGLGAAFDSSPILDEISDLNWGIAKWPFRSKYKNLNRIFNASFQLPQSVPLTKNFRTGATINPPITASLLGTILYASRTRFALNFPDVFSATPANAANIEFERQLVLGRGIGQTRIESIALCNSPNSPSDSTTTPVYIAVGGTSQSYLLISTDGVNWTPADPTVLDFGLQDIAYSVNESGNDSWAAWIIITKSNSTPILYTTTNKIPSATSWGTRPIGGGLGIGNEVFGITFNDPEGAFPTDSHFVICGGGPGGGFVVTSSDRIGTFWSTKTFIGGGDELFDICFSTANNTLIVVGEAGAVLTSNNRQGSAWTSRTSTVAVDLNAVAHRDGTSTVIAVGNSGTIIRSTNNGQTWTDVSPGGLGVLYDVAPGNPGDNINWIVVGVNSSGNGAILVSTDDGVTWTSLPASRFENYTKTFRAVVAAAIDANSNVLTGGPKYVVGGDGSSDTRNLLMRVTDLSSDVFITSSNPGGRPFIHELATLSTGGLKTRDTQNVRAKFEDFSKGFLGMEMELHQTLERSIQVLWELA